MVFLQIPVYAQGTDVSFDSTYESAVVTGTTQGQGENILYVTELPSGETINLDTYGEAVPIGSRVYLEHFTDQGYYNFVAVNRNKGILILLTVFIFCILALAGKKGVRSLIALGASMGLLFWVLVPLLVNGFDPIVTTLVFGLGVLGFSIFITHGLNRQSLVSFIGSFSSIVIAAVLLYCVTRAASMTGFIDDHIQYLSFATDNTLNLVRIISASVLIGILGVLDDITITQVAVVRELSDNDTLSKRNIFQKSLRVGRDHVASLVNTLVFAYLGATLPMVMYVSLLEIPFWILTSYEFIFVEIIRSLIGAIALTLAVPVTTWLATYVFIKSIRTEGEAFSTACSHNHH